MGFYFYPRGGSAQVARYLCRALAGGPWEALLFSGSSGEPSEVSNAERFYAGLGCESLDYSPAQLRWLNGGDSMDGLVPMHASYERKHDVADCIFFELDDAAFNRQVASWVAFFRSHAVVHPTIVHLHHLTPMHEAVRAVWPDVPVVTHLHGTELKMLALSSDDTSGVRHPAREDRWVARLERWAGQSARVIVVSKQDELLVRQLLPVPTAKVVTITNGVDTHVFAPRPKSRRQRLEMWRSCLVDDPQGWRPGGAPGSITYQPNDMAAFVDDDGADVPVVLFAGRFMTFKRVGLLVEAFHEMNTTSACRSVLVIAGGFPGEWEGEHPFETVHRLGVRNVFFTGWRDHSGLAEMLNCSDIFAAPAVDEPFGLVYLEAMASGLPPIATNTGGPLSFINVDASRPSGWLVPPDDTAALVAALSEAVSQPGERLRRGARAAQFVRRHYSWAACARAIGVLYDEVAAENV